MCAGTTAQPVSIRTTLAMVEEYGLTRLLGEVTEDLSCGVCAGHKRARDDDVHDWCRVRGA